MLMCGVVSCISSGDGATRKTRSRLRAKRGPCYVTSTSRASRRNPFYNRGTAVHHSEGFAQVFKRRQIAELYIQHLQIASI